MGTSLDDQGAHPASLLVPDHRSDPNPGLERLRMKVECSLEQQHKELTLYVHSKPNVILMVGLDCLGGVVTPAVGAAGTTIVNL